MVAAAIIGSAVVGGVVASNSASKAAKVASQGTQAASDATQAQLDFTKQQYADQKPTIDAANKLALSSAAQDQAIAKQQADNSQTAWAQNQQATQASVGQMGLNALGAQYLSPAQTQQLVQLQQQMATGTPEQKAAAQAQIAQLQTAAEQAGIGLENAKAATVQNTAATQGAQVTGAYGANADSTKQIGASLAAGQNALAADTAGKVTNIGGQDANAILANGDTSAAALNAAGTDRLNQQTGFYDDQASKLQATAKQRAIDFERDQTTQANADIANSADQSQRQLLRLGGDPNRMAAMAGDISNNQQLARISAGNQIATTNVANLNTADDQARGLQQTGFNAGTAQQYSLGNQALSTKSAALDAARQARTGAAQTALGITSGAASQGLQTVAGADQTAANTNLAGATAGQGITYAGQNQANAINNAAKDKVDTNLNALQQGTANYGAGFANTSGTTAQTALAAGTAGVNGLNSATTTAAAALSPTQNATNGVVNAANTAVNAAGAIQKAGDAAGANIAGMGSMVGGYLANPSAFIGSSKKIKKNRAKVDPNAVIDGLEQALPQTYEYKDGEGPPGQKVGPMAEDMNAQFGDGVAPGGKAINIQNSIGLHHAAIVGLSRRLAKVEKRKGA